jgi:hypothetical protein
MSRGAIFWVLMIVTAVLGLYGHWGAGQVNYAGAGLTLLELILFGLLGWKVFGPAVHE